MWWAGEVMYVGCRHTAGDKKCKTQRQEARKQKKSIRLVDTQKRQRQSRCPAASIVLWPAWLGGEPVVRIL
jgi:hypothetical protein